MTFKKNYVLAIDTGSSGIRLGVFAEIKGRITLLNHAMLPISLTEESDNSRESNETIISLALEKLLSQCSINPKKVIRSIVSIPGRQVGLKQISTVKLAEEELETSLLFEARKHLPVKGDEVLLDYQIVNDKNDSLDLILAVSARQTIESIHRIFEHCSLKPDVIDVPILSVNNAILSSTDTNENHTLLIHCGHSLTHVSLVTSNGEFIARDIPIAGKHFTEELRKEKQITFEEAEAIKLEKGIMNADNNTSQSNEVEGISLALASSGTNKAVESLTRELQRSVRFFMKETDIKEVEKIFLSGGACNDKSFTEHLSKELRLPVDVFDPFTFNSIDTDIKEQIRPQFTQLVGLGIRRIKDAI